ncbi:MAG: PKD domain-containing protein, partial [Candidatus Thermoplasmatota archaeon]
VDRVFDVAGTFALFVWARDTSGNTAFAVEPLVIVPGAAPVADAGPDQTVSWSELVAFDGTGSSDDFGIVAYRWTLTYNGTAVELAGPTPTFRFNRTGTYVVTLVVEDVGGRQGTDTVEITVRLPPPPPGGKDGSPQWWVFLLVLVLLGAVALGLVWLLRRRKDKEGKGRPTGDDEEPPEDGENALKELEEDL